MDRRELLGLMGAGSVGMFAVGATTARAQDHQHDQEGDEHLQVMAECARHCAEAAHHCLDQLRRGSGNGEKHANALAHAAACEEFCILSAKQMACKSPLAYLAHQANSEACDRCAQACEGIEGEIMQACVESCRKCAEVCKLMAQKGEQRRSR